MKRLPGLLSLTILLLILMVLIVWPFGPDMAVQEAQQNIPQDKLVLRFGYNIPERSALHLAAERFKTAIEQRTDGRVQVQLFPNQILGNDHQMLEMARQGKLELLLIPSAKLSSAVPEMQYADLPFLLPTRQDLYTMLDGEPGRLLLEKLNRINIVGAAFWGNGFKHFTANRPLKTPSDFAGLNIRIMKSRLLRDQFNLMGAEAVPIDFHETRQALMDGVVDGQENPLVAIHSMGIHEAQTDLTLSEHAYLAYVFAISEKRFNQLPGHLQTLLLETARELTSWQRAETDRQEDEFLSEIRASGTRIHHLSESQRILFRQAMQPLADRFESIIGPDILAYTHEYAVLKHPRENRWLIGVDTDLSTAAPELGLEVKRGVELAVERFQKSDPMLTPDIQVITRDNRNLAGRSQRTLDDYSREPGMLGIVAGAGPLALQAHHTPDSITVPVINPWMTLPAHSKAHSPLINLVATSDKLAAQLISDLKNRGIQTVHLIVETTAWSESLTRAIETEAVKAGLHIESSVILNHQRPLAAQLDTQHGIPDATILVLYSRLLQESLNWFKDQPQKPLLVSTLDWAIPADAPEVLSMQGHLREDIAAHIMSMYRKRYGSEPASISTLMQSHDAGWMLLMAAARCEAKLYENMTQALQAAPCEQAATDYTQPAASDLYFDTKWSLKPASRLTDGKRGAP